MNRLSVDEVKMFKEVIDNIMLEIQNQLLKCKIQSHLGGIGKNNKILQISFNHEEMYIVWNILSPLRLKIYYNQENHFKIFSINDSNLINDSLDYILK